MFRVVNAHNRGYVQNQHRCWNMDVAGKVVLITTQNLVVTCQSNIGGPIKKTSHLRPIYLKVVEGAKSIILSTRCIHSYNKNI